MKKTISIMLCLFCVFLMACGSRQTPQISKVSQTPKTSKASASVAADGFMMAIAWTDEPSAYSIQCMGLTAKETGENFTTLDMIRSYDLSYDEKGMLVDATDSNGILTHEAARLVKENTWLNSNVEEVMEGVDCIIFPGGKDISPTLYYNEQSWHGIEEDTSYSAERDVSDYLLMDYCLDNDIPILAICRGMQMLSAVSGADMIQDIQTWLAEQGIEYTDIHRDPEKKRLVPHPVTVLSKDSLFYNITGKIAIDNCPSWHHQMVGNVDGTRLTVTGETDTNGINTIEAVERADRTFCLGLQFHPEVAVGKIVKSEADAGDFFDYDTAMSFFKALIEAGKEYDKEELERAA